MCVSVGSVHAFMCMFVSVFYARGRLAYVYVSVCTCVNACMRTCCARDRVPVKLCE